MDGTFLVLHIASFICYCVVLILLCLSMIREIFSDSPTRSLCLLVSKKAGEEDLPSAFIVHNKRCPYGFSSHPTQSCANRGFQCLVNTCSLIHSITRHTFPCVKVPSFKMRLRLCWLCEHAPVSLPSLPVLPIVYVPLTLSVCCFQFSRPSGLGVGRRRPSTLRHS